MTRLVSTREVAAMLGLTPDTVRARAADLGAMRVHDGPRAPLRFDPDEVLRRVQQRRIASTEPVLTPQRPGPKAKPAGVHLLPLPEEAR